MTRYELTRMIAYRLYEHRQGGPGSPFGDWFLAEELIALVESVLQLLLEILPSPAPQPPPVAEKRLDASPAVADRPVEVQRKAKAKPKPKPKPKKLAPAAILKLLEKACAKLGRKQVAALLGYASASSVGRILQGKRRLTPELIEKICEGLDEAV